MLIKEIRKEIARVLAADTDLGETMQVHIYDSSQLPGKYNRELCVYSAGSSPTQYPVIGKSSGAPVYQYVLYWIVKFDSGQLAAMEDVCDDVENAVYRILGEENYRNSLWRKIVFPNFSLRPLAPGGVNNAHPGRVLVRIIT